MPVAEEPPPSQVTKRTAYLRHDEDRAALKDTKHPDVLITGLSDAHRRHDVDDETRRHITRRHIGPIAGTPDARSDATARRLRAAKDPQKDNNNNDDGRGSGTAVITRTRTQTRRPGMYRVLLLNDDYTPMEFVVVVLRKYFSKGPEEATRIMLHVHQHGVGECGVFTYEVAETKVTQVMDFARKNQHPLQCIMEKK